MAEAAVETLAVAPVLLQEAVLPVLLQTLLVTQMLPLRLLILAVVEAEVVPEKLLQIQVEVKVLQA